MLNVERTIEQIATSVPFVNLWRANQVSEFLEKAANDSSYINKVAHIQQNTKNLSFPMLVSGQFKVDEENTRTLTRCIKSRVELESVLLCLYDWHVDILDKEKINKAPHTMYQGAKKLFIGGEKTVAHISYGYYDKFVEINPEDSEFQILLNNVKDFPGHLFLLDEEAALITIECFSHHYSQERKAEYMLELCKLIKAKGIKDSSGEYEKQFIKTKEKILGY